MINAAMRRRITKSAGRYLAVARFRAGISQRDLAWTINGSSRGAIAHIEQGRNAPTIDLFCTLCERLSLDPAIALAHAVIVAASKRITREQLFDLIEANARLVREHGTWVDAARGKP